MGGFSVHAEGHVHYGMMMIAAASEVGEITADIQPATAPFVNTAVDLGATLCMNGG